MMSARFKGPNGQRRLREALIRQEWVDGNAQIAAELAKVCRPVEYEAGAIVVQQGASPCGRLFLVLAGELDVIVNGNRVGNVRRDMAAGEIPLLHPGVNHTVTLSARCDSVVGEVDEERVAEMAEHFPSIWKNMARVLALRLDGRAAYYPSVNSRPRVFVGASSEGLQIAREVQLGLEHDLVTTVVWTDDVFSASRTAIESLVDEVWRCDFGVFVMTPDDIIRSRSRAEKGPRDNVVFELGLFIGRLGRDRTMIVAPRDVVIKFPSDLLGIVKIEYEASGDDATVSARMGAANTRIRKQINSLGVVSGLGTRR